MLRKLMLIYLLPGLLFALTSCKATVTTVLASGDATATTSVDVDVFSASKAGAGTLLGRGTVWFGEFGVRVSGEFFDVEGDGKPDRFRPYANQRIGNSVLGYMWLDGRRWVDIKFDGCDRPTT